MIASGWFTASRVARQLVTGFVNDLATLGGRVMHDARWHRPVRPIDVLSASIEVREKEPSERNPAIGRYRVDFLATGEDGEAVLSMGELGVAERQGPDESA